MLLNIKSQVKFTQRLCLSISLRLACDEVVRRVQGMHHGMTLMTLRRPHPHPYPHPPLFCIALRSFTFRGGLGKGPCSPICHVCGLQPVPEGVCPWLLCEAQAALSYSAQTYPVLCPRRPNLPCPLPQTLLSDSAGEVGL